MTNREQKILYRDREYILVDMSEDGERPHGPITTPEAYANFEESYAHLYPDGNIRRYNSIVGRIDEIVFTGVFIDVDIDPLLMLEAISRGGFNPSANDSEA